MKSKIGRGDRTKVSSTDVAIVGMSCRFPGEGTSPDSFFDFLLNGGDGISNVPADRWDINAYFNSDTDKANRMHVKRGGFISDIENFDPQFFGISPKEAPHIDPQHRWLLELTHEAFENANIVTRDLYGSDTAVYIGQFMHDYELIQFDSVSRARITSHTATGQSMALASNRISYCFNFTGPSVTLDTACSSSLVALDMACKAIINGDSQVAVAGGVNILLRPESTMSFCKASLLSGDGKCKSFDAAANGYVRSEGAGLVVLKKLSDAQADGNQILAVIKATGVNQDGHTSGITVPNGHSQQILLQKSLAKAGFASKEIQYAEAHGTGTALGDPIELNALGKTLGLRDRLLAKCAVGSVKSNIGHTESAAGMAGLIKTVMALNTGTIPGNIHYNNINPAIDLAELNISIAAENTQWPETYGKSRKAIVNSFGFGGTNANVVLEQAPPRDTHSARKPQSDVKQLTISAKTPEGLKQQAQKYFDLCFSFTDSEDLDDLCYSAALGRDHFKHRLVISGKESNEIAAGIKCYLNSKPDMAYVSGSASRTNHQGVAFVFSGMGTTWPAMGMELYRRHPIFRQMMDRCSKALKTHSGWSLIEAIGNQENPKLIYETRIAQPAIFAVQVSLVALLDSWGVKANCIVGHSAGEVAAAYVAGVFDFDDAIKIIYHRSQLQHTTEGMGSMLAVRLTELEIKPYLLGVEDRVSIAAINSEQAITLSGETNSLQLIYEKLEQLGIFARFLKVGVPYHSPVMDRLKTSLISALQGIRVHSPHTALYSTVSGELTKEGDWGPEYWADNVRKPVLFKKAIDNIQATGTFAFVEVAPHSALSGAMEDNIKQSGNSVVIATLLRGKDDCLMAANTLASLHCRGFKVNWKLMYPEERQWVQLPNYAWQHQGFWHESEEQKAARINNSHKQGNFSYRQHPLLGSRLSSTTALWQNNLELQELCNLLGHQIDGEIIYPNSAYVEMALKMAIEKNAQFPLCLEGVEFSGALVVSTGKGYTLESVYDGVSGDYRICAIDNNSKQWVQYSQGTISHASALENSTPLAISAIISSLPQEMVQSDFYKHCRQLGLNISHNFQAVSHVWYSDMDSLVRLNLPAEELQQLDDYLLHPVLLESAFQSLFATLDCPYLPEKIDSVIFKGKPSGKGYAYLQTNFKDAEQINCDLRIIDDQGEILIELRGVELHARTVSVSEQQSELNLLYNYQWRQQTLPKSTENSNQHQGQWLILADKQGVAEQLAQEMHLRSQKTTCLYHCAHMEQALTDTLEKMDGDCLGVIYLWGIDSLDVSSSHADIILQTCLNTSVTPANVFKIINKSRWKLPPRFYLCSQSAHRIPGDSGKTRAVQHSFWGAARALSNAYPQYQVSLVDLGQTVSQHQINLVADEMLHDSYEQEVLLREQGRFVHRLCRTSADMLANHSHYTTAINEDTSFKLGFDKLSTVSQLRAFCCDDHIELATDEFELRVERVSIDRQQLNHLELANAGRNEPGELYEYLGTIVSCGAGVAQFATGERVMAISRQTPASFIRVNANLALPISRLGSQQVYPEHLSNLRAGVISQYVLQHAASLREGQSMLIHNAGGIVGYTLAEFAKAKSLDVYATAIKQSDREQLQQLGLSGVFSATIDTYRDVILNLTCGKGVDLVVNFAMGPHSNQAATLLCPCAPFVDMVSSNSPQLLATLASNSSSYSQIELTQLLENNPQVISQSLNQCRFMFQHKPSYKGGKTFSVQALQETSDFLQGCDSDEKVILDFSTASITALRSVKQNIIGADKSYLVTGGLEAIGLEIIDWLATNGAKHIALTGSTMVDRVALESIERVHARGVNIAVFTADVSQATDLDGVLTQICQNGPILGGIFHCAGSPGYPIHAEQSDTSVGKTQRLKTLGSWNLHQQTNDIDLDFFICCSSASEILTGSGLYIDASANAFMDGLCDHRNAMGKPGTSINWGPWASGSMTKNCGEENTSLALIEPKRGLAAMAMLMTSSLPQAGIFDVDWSTLVTELSHPCDATILSDLINIAEESGDDRFLQRLNASQDEVKRELLTTKTCQYLAHVLGLESSEGLEQDANIFEYGLNSLMAIDLKNRLQAVLEMQLPATLVLKHPSVNAIVEYILVRRNRAKVADISVVRSSQKVKVSI